MPRYTDDQIIEALRRTRGMVYVAAQALQCSPETIKRRIAKSPRVAHTVEEETTRSLDWAELRLFEAVQRGEPWAIQFMLKTKGKDRGYTERTEHRIESAIRSEAERIAKEQGLDVDEVVREAERILGNGQ